MQADNNIWTHLGGELQKSIHPSILHKVRMPSRSNNMQSTSPATSIIGLETLQFTWATWDSWNFPVVGYGTLVGYPMSIQRVLESLSQQRLHFRPFHLCWMINTVNPKVVSSLSIHRICNHPKIPLFIATMKDPIADIILSLHYQPSKPLE